MGSDPKSTPPNRPKNSKRSDPRKSDKPQSNNLFWYLMVGLILAFVVFAVSSKTPRGTELTFREFSAGVKNGKSYHQNNCYELIFSPAAISFQDQPKELVSKNRDSTVKRFFISTRGIPSEHIAELTSLLDAEDIEYTGAKDPADWSLAYLLLIPAMFLLFFVLLFRRMGGAGTAMSFGRSRGKLYAQEDVDITFDDAAGIDEAVEELREVVEFLRTPGKYQALGGRIPRGVLLVGPPGTGKTLLAKAVAGEADVPFYGLSGSDFVEMFVGVGAARVRDMFQQAGQRSPSIIFIDELDALGKVRGSGMPGGHDEREQTLNALLVEMDGFGSDQSVIVMAATNRPETLDPALMRPGRFDRHVLVDRPDIKGREAILKVHACKIKMDDGVDLKRISKLTPGFVGADLANLVNEAALLAARRNDTRVMMDCFEEGIERVMAGLEKSSRIINEDVKLRVAYHECGHALVACSLPHTDPVHKISIIPRGLGALGYTMQLPEDDRNLLTKSELQNRICVLLGGIASEDLIYAESSTGAQNDLQRATDISRSMVTEFGMSPKLGRMYYGDAQRSAFLPGATTAGDPVHSEDTIREIDLEVKRIVDECMQTALDCLTSQKETLEHMTRDLMESETMNSDHLQKILAEHSTGPKIKPGTHSVTEDAPPIVTDRSEESDNEAPPLDSADGA
jgi:cell division protease FtsH